MDGDFDFNVMMDLDDDFARENAGYGAYRQDPFVYDPTFNPHDVGAYSDVDESGYGFNPGSEDEYDDWQQPNVNTNRQLNAPTVQPTQEQQVRTTI
jgi:hypothetical protein